MGIFGFGSKKDKDEIAYLKAENKALRKEAKHARKRERELVDLCEEKDSYFMELMSDGLRHGSPLAAKHMSDRKKYLNGE